MKTVHRSGLVHASLVLVAAAAAARPILTFRIQPERSHASAFTGVPIEYRLRIGSGDRIAVWTFTALIRPDEQR